MNLDALDSPMDSHSSTEVNAPRVQQDVSLAQSLEDVLEVHVSEDICQRTAELHQPRVQQELLVCAAPEELSEAQHVESVKEKPEATADQKPSPQDADEDASQCTDTEPTHPLTHRSSEEVTSAASKTDLTEWVGIQNYLDFEHFQYQ